jgi:hypothetical protein
VTFTTLHGRLDAGYLASIAHRFADARFVSVSDSQRVTAKRMAENYSELYRALAPFADRPAKSTSLPQNASIAADTACNLDSHQ